MRRDGDTEAIRAIRNHAIEHPTAHVGVTVPVAGLDRPRLSLETFARRSAYVAEADGEVIGFANWVPWRPKDGYRHTVEDSVYLTEGHQGSGLGAEQCPERRSTGRPPVSRRTS